jgi:hypothetical protein
MGGKSSSTSGPFLFFSCVGGVEFSHLVRRDAWCVAMVERSSMTLPADAILKSMYEDPRHADIWIERSDRVDAAEGMVLPQDLAAKPTPTMLHAHRAVLTVASPFFRDLLRNCCSGRHLVLVPARFSDVAYSMVLRFWYTGSLFSKGLAPEIADVLPLARFLGCDGVTVAVLGALQQAIESNTWRKSLREAIALLPSTCAADYALGGGSKNAVVDAVISLVRRCATLCIEEVQSPTKQFRSEWMHLSADELVCLVRPEFGTWELWSLLPLMAEWCKFPPPVSPLAISLSSSPSFLCASSSSCSLPAPSAPEAENAQPDLDLSLYPDLDEGRRRADAPIFTGAFLEERRASSCKIMLPLLQLVGIGEILAFQDLALLEEVGMRDRDVLQLLKRVHAIPAGLQLVQKTVVSGGHWARVQECTVMRPLDLAVPVKTEYRTWRSPHPVPLEGVSRYTFEFKEGGERHIKPRICVGLVTQQAGDRDVYLARNTVMFYTCGQLIWCDGKMQPAIFPDSLYSLNRPLHMRVRPAPSAKSRAEAALGTVEFSIDEGKTWRSGGGAVLHPGVSYYPAISLVTPHIAVTLPSL